MTRALLALAVMLAACDEDPPPPAPPPPEPAPRPDPGVPTDDDPLVGLDDPEAIDDEPEVALPGEVPSAPTLEAATPEGGCVALTGSATRLWPRAGPSAIVASGDGFFVAGYSAGQDGGEQVFVVHARPEALPRPVRSFPVDPPATPRMAPPGLDATGSGVSLGWIDGDGSVRIGDVPATGAAEIRWVEVDDLGDARFAPAVRATSGGRRAVAWTRGGTPMRVHLSRLASGRIEQTHDLTPPAGGAAAPTFVAGAPELMFLDPRMGVSPVYRAPLGEDGAPGEVVVARPIGNAFEPPELAAARVGDRTLVGYTAVGNAATSAVGVVPVPGDGPPAALVPGTGYGPVHVSVATSGAAAVFAADAPTDGPPSSPRRVDVRVVRDAAPGPALAVTAPDGTGRHGGVARRADGVLGVVLTAGDGVYVRWLRCDDGA